MKRNLFTLLMMLAVQGLIARTTVIVCNAEGELPNLLSEKVQETTELVIRGSISAEDIKAVNNYPKIKSLNLTDAQLSVIPSKTWDNLHSLQELYLPKTIDTLYLDAISCEKSNKNWIDIYLPGKFPHLRNYPVDSERNLLYLWNVTEDNDLLIVESYDVQYPDMGGGIFSADKKILYKALPDEYGYFDGIKGYMVDKVWDYAFSQLSAGDYIEIMIHGVKEIANSAFCDFTFAYSTGSVDYSGMYVHLLVDMPPTKFGEGNLNHHLISASYFFVVSDIDLYIQDDPSWGELNLKDANGIRWGTNIESVSTSEDSLTPYYDLQGRPVANPTRGIYIKDGRKVILK